MGRMGLVHGGAIREVTDYDTSTLHCPCGASFTWSGFSDKLQPWMDEHSAHVESAEIAREISLDGMRAYGGQATLRNRAC